MRKVLLLGIVFVLFPTIGWGQQTGTKPAEVVTDKMQEVPTKLIDDALVVKPAHRPTEQEEKALREKALRDDRSYWFAEPPAPSSPKAFTAEAFNGLIKTGVRQLVALKDGRLAVATRNGAYLISQSGKMEVVGRGNDCGAIAVSTQGEIAFGFAMAKERRLHVTYVDQRSFTIIDHPSVLEIYVAGANPRVILLGQRWTHDQSITRLAYNADGTILAILSYPNGLVLVEKDKAWWHPTRFETSRYGHGLMFHPTDLRKLVCSGYHLDVNTDGSCARRYVGDSASFGPDANLIHVQKNADYGFDLHDGVQAARLKEYRHVGVDRMAIHKEVLAYTVLDYVHIWDRKSQKIIQSLRNVPQNEWRWAPGYVEALTFREDGNVIVASSNGEIAEWEPMSGRKLRVLHPPLPIIKK